MNQYEIGTSLFANLLLLLFIGLKLTHYIDWSWWWVLSPAWITVSIAMIVVIVGLMILLIKNKRSI